MFKNPAILFAITAIVWWIIAGISLADGDRFAWLDVLVAVMFTFTTFSFYMGARQRRKWDQPDGAGEYNGIIDVGDVIDYFETVRPRWWQARRIEEVKHRKLMVQSAEHVNGITRYTGMFINE